jgi:hypothetical protein
MVLDGKGPVAVEHYASRIATTGEYAGNVEIAIMARLTQHDIVVHSTDQGCKRTIRVDDSGRSKQRYPSYYIAHYVEAQHFQSIHSPAWSACQYRLQISPRSFGEEGNSFKGISFTSTGRFTEDRISGGRVCGQESFKKIVELQGGTFTNLITSTTQVMIAGEEPSLPSLTEAKKRGIVTVSFALLRVRIRWEITSNVFIQMGKYMGETVDASISGESGLVPSGDTQLGAQPGRGETDQMEVEGDNGGAAAHTTDHAITPARSIKSALKPKTTPMISIDQAALNRIRNVDEITPRSEERL